MKYLWTDAWKHGKNEFSAKISKNLTPFVHFENKMSQASAQKLGNISFEVDFKTWLGKNSLQVWVCSYFWNGKM